MYTSTYSSSPVRTSTSGVGSTNYQPQSSDRQYNQPSSKINYNTMDDGNMSLRRANTAYSNSASSLTSIPVRTTTPSRKYTNNYNNSPNDLTTNRYQSTASYRSHDGDNEIFRSNNPRHDSSGNARAHSYDDLHNEPNQPHRSQPSVYNSSTRVGGNNNNPYGQQQQQQRRDQYTDYDDDLIVKSTDLASSNEQEMLELVRLAFRKYDLGNQRELAGFLKRSADKAFSTCWHCIVGRQFSSYVTHEMNGFIYLTKGPLSILLFKSGS
jgi:dynein light chain LC8-type